MDLGRRRFFRQFAAEVIHTAATAAGAAGALQRAASDAAGALLNPEAALGLNQPAPPVNPMIAATPVLAGGPSLPDPTAAQANPALGESGLPNGVPDGPRADRADRPAQAARTAGRIPLRRRRRGRDGDQGDGGSGCAGAGPGGRLRPGPDGRSFTGPAAVGTPGPTPRCGDRPPPEPADGRQHRLGGRSNARPGRAAGGPGRGWPGGCERPPRRGGRDLCRGNSGPRCAGRARPGGAAGNSRPGTPAADPLQHRAARLWPVRHRPRRRPGGLVGQPPPRRSSSTRLGRISRAPGSRPGSSSRPACPTP